MKHIKLLWKKFLSFTVTERKRWAVDYKLAELNHNKLLKSQNGISQNNGGKKRPSSSYDHYVRNYKIIIPSAKKRKIDRDWNDLSDRSVFVNLRAWGQQLLKNYEDDKDDEDEPTEVENQGIEESIAAAAAATLTSHSAVGTLVFLHLFICCIIMLD